MKTRRSVAARVCGAATAASLAAVGAVAWFSMTGTASAATAAGTGVGYLHTDGANIVDSRGSVVRLTGINWFGNETDTGTFHGLWAGKPATWTEQIDHMAQLGYNTIRVPYTGSVIRSTSAVTGVNSDTNPDLQGLTALQILDKVVERAGQNGMRILLDRHRPTTASQTPLWNGGGVSEASEISDWQFLAQHYAGNTTVIGADLFNEPHAEGTEPTGTGAEWGGVEARDWRLAAQRIGNAILGTNSNWLIVVEGVSCDGPTGGSPNVYDNVPDDPMACTWWGGNLSKAGDQPVQLSVPNRVVYSPHEYGISVYDRQPWFKDSNFPNNLPDVWDHFWGYLVKQNIAPVLIGEFGSTLQNPMDVQWLKTLMSYIGKNGMSFTYWSWNPNSGDTGGIVGDDWYTVNQTKQDILSPYLVPPVRSGSQPPVSQGPTSQPPSITPSSQPPSSRQPSSQPPTSRPPSSQPPASSPAATGACSATYKSTNTWQGGFQGEITVKAGSAPINGWTVTFTLDSGESISQLWNGTLTTSGGTSTVKSLSWNGSLGAGATTAFGFLGSGGSNAPSAITCTSS